ncbi:MAG: hypothetical protein CVT63_03855 [Candidatus Anoxymicrobium japonicum]|uniref:Uncharacterized protein n=1 Tax=Candidatus Anoxymicrobium japonicum TaxID=2013648 RepID=A0A2N3G699_9ACTN|nr:MAG: hypothetical protein CVT63_03855 [Candidatus Anoxymicrobium japonicum]
MRKSRSALVVGHQYPDGDAIGSVLGLSLMLRASGYAVEASWPEPFEIPVKYSFLPGMDILAQPDRLTVKDPVIFAMDCANAGRMEELKERALQGPLVNIDHHPDNTYFGNANLVDANAAAASQVLYMSAESLGLTVDANAACCLYAGIVTDTGRFQFSNTTAETLRMAAELVERGVKPHAVFENVYQSDSLAYLRLSGEVLTRSVYDRELSLIYGYVSQDDLKKFGVKMNETEDMIDNLRSLRGHRVVALFKELPDKTIRVSLRSRIDVDIGVVARRLKGGGHKVAAGYTSSKSSISEALFELKEEIIASGRSSDSR